MGLTFLFAGLEKVVRGTGYVVPYFAELGVPWPEVSGPLVSYLETIGGLALLVGMATPLVAALFACEMLVAIALVRLPEAATAASVVDAFGALRLEALLAAAATALALMGSGRWSVDAVLTRRRLAIRVGGAERGRR